MGVSKWLRGHLGGNLYGDDERLLTKGERDLIGKIFGNAPLPPLSWVHIRNGLSPSGTAITIRDGSDYSIMVGQALFDDDMGRPDTVSNKTRTLVHEMTHVWQWNQGTLNKSHGLIAHAHYTIRSKLHLGKGDEALYEYDVFHNTWNDMGFEGQAQMVEEWFRDGMKETDERFVFVKKVLRSGDRIARELTLDELRIPPDEPPKPDDEPVRVTMPDSGLITITLKSDLLFDTDKSNLKPGSNDTLEDAAQKILAIKGANKVLFNGHTDNTGDATYNLRLSEQRAKVVAQWFALHRYIPQSMIQTQGFGKTQARHNDAAGRAKDRRVEIYVYTR